MIPHLAVALLASPVPADEGGLRVLWDVELRSTSFGGAAVADADGDGKLEVAFATYFGDSSVRVLNGEDGSVLWHHQGGGAGKDDECLDASVRFTDVDGDDVLDLIVPVSNSSHVIAFDAKRGDVKWRYEAGLGECIDTPPFVGDVNGDGKRDVVVGTFKGRLHVIDGMTGRAHYMIKVAPGAVQSGAAVLDVDGDGVLDYVAANFNGDHRVHAVSGVFDDDVEALSRPDGTLVVDGPRELWHVQTGAHMYHGCSQADLDGDGAPELIVASYDGKVYALRLDGSELWSVAPGERYIMAPTTVADVDGDGEPEVIATSDRVTVINADGTILYSKIVERPPFNSWGVTRGVAVADLDGDGGLDLTFTNGKGVLRVLRGRDGELLYEFDAADVHDKPLRVGSHCPTIADLDGDGRLDVFYVVGGDAESRHGRALCITGFAGTGPGWYQFRHDHLNTGNVETPLDPALRKRIPR